MSDPFGCLLTLGLTLGLNVVRFLQPNLFVCPFLWSSFWSSLSGASYHVFPVVLVSVVVDVWFACVCLILRLLCPFGVNRLWFWLWTL